MKKFNSQVQSFRKVANIAALLVGALVVGSGCGQAQAQAADSSAPAQAGQPVPAQPFKMPVRVSRAFFEYQLSGKIIVQGKAVESAVAWKESVPTDAAPVPTAETGPILADFRDSEGCASFSDVDGAELCFKLMGDVSNVGLNAREMKVNGLSAVIDRQLGQPCPGAEWNAKFNEATRDTDQGLAGEFTVSFTAVPADAQACQAGPVQVDVTLSRM